MCVTIPETAKADWIAATCIEEASILYSPQLVQQERGGIYLLIDPLEPNWASSAGM